MFKNGNNIGGGRINIDTSISDYMVVEIPLFYSDTTGVIPDSASMLFWINTLAPLGSSTVYLDNFGFDGFYSDSVNADIPVIYATGEDDFKMHIFPNPASSKINLLFENADTCELEILDIRGAKMLSQKNTRSLITLDVSNFANGIYVVKANSDSKQVTSRFVIQK